MPERIRLSRAKGWRKPEGAITVSRPSRWGNPWKVGDPHPSTGTPLSQAEAVELFVPLFDPMDPALDPLRGRDLACWCKLSDPCHADVLLRLSNP